MSVNGRLLASELAPIAGGQLRKDAAAAWNAMNVIARQRGLELLPGGPVSSYRTYEEQVTLWDEYQAGGNLAAQPGQSNHGWGLAVDVATPAMRALLDKIGPPFGWSKTWSDAPSEWWHIKYAEGTYSGIDPGPEGIVIPVPETGISVVHNEAGEMEVFIVDDQGAVFTKRQHKTGGWSPDWKSLGKP